MGSEDQAVQVEEVVVSARRAGLPMWTVRKGDDGVLILVGMIREVPKGFEWRAEALEGAVRRVDRVLFPQDMRASPADILRILWRSRTIVVLPDQQTLDQVIPAADYERLVPLKAYEKRESWRRIRPLLVARDLVQERAGEDGSRDPRVERVAERAARRANIKTHSIGVVRGSELVESLISSPDETQLSCLRAAMGAAEYGANAMADRAEAWRRLDVKAVLASPFDEAMDECWPWGDPSVRVRMRTEWVNAISTAIADEGVTLAVAPIRTLGEADGVLDQLVAAGYEIDGPDWK
ncbi:TraB/GumN family protein [Brevundimonas sp. UBA5866]|uniref:TraB/GumN family protein n=1 Tax=Brevundimonas sp. UBA5866 TaxID=1946132 RepID=UPI0025B929A8|nr:TraB/GumN family protein [Brevundimonas sp. UBA5866]